MVTYASYCGSSRHFLHRGTTSNLLTFALQESLPVTNLREVRLGHPELSLLHYQPEQQQLLASLNCTCSSSFFPNQGARLCFSFPILTLHSQRGHQLLPTYFSPTAPLPFISHSKPCQPAPSHQHLKPWDGSTGLGATGLQQPLKREVATSQGSTLMSVVHIMALAPRRE